MKRSSAVPSPEPPMGRRRIALLICANSSWQVAFGLSSSGSAVRLMSSTSRLTSSRIANRPRGALRDAVTAAEPSVFAKEKIQRPARLARLEGRNRSSVNLSSIFWKFALWTRRSDRTGQLWTPSPSRSSRFGCTSPPVPGVCLRSSVQRSLMQPKFFANVGILSVGVRAGV